MWYYQSKKDDSADFMGAFIGMGVTESVANRMNEFITKVNAGDIFITKINEANTNAFQDRRISQYIQLRLQYVIAFKKRL